MCHFAWIASRRGVNVDGHAGTSTCPSPRHANAPGPRSRERQRVILVSMATMRAEATWRHRPGSGRARPWPRRRRGWRRIEGRADRATIPRVRDIIARARAIIRRVRAHHRPCPSDASLESETSSPAHMRSSAVSETPSPGAHAIIHPCPRHHRPCHGATIRSSPRHHRPCTCDHPPCPRHHRPCTCDHRAVSETSSPVHMRSSPVSETRSPAHMPISSSGTGTRTGKTPASYASASTRRAMSRSATAQSATRSAPAARRADLGHDVDALGAHRLGLLGGAVVEHRHEEAALVARVREAALARERVERVDAGAQQPAVSVARSLVAGARRVGVDEHARDGGEPAAVAVGPRAAARVAERRLDHRALCLVARRTRRARRRGGRSA